MSEQELRHIPLEDLHVELGAKMVPFSGFLMPLQYTGIKDEHLAVRTRAGLFDVSHMGEIEIRGPRAIEVVDGLVSNDATKLVDGQAMYALLCNEDGGIVDDLVFYRLAEDHVLMCVNAGNRAKDLAHVQKYARTDAETTLTDTGDDYVQLALQGPDAGALLQPLVDCDLAGMKAFRCQYANFGGARILVARTGYTGEDGFELYIPTDAGRMVAETLTTTYSRDELALCGLGCRDTLRLEAKLHLYGQDMGDDTDPFEAGLGWVVKLDKATAFVGQEALRSSKEKGVQRRLRGLVVEGRGIIRQGHEIYVGDEHVGVVTSGSYSPTLEQSIGLGYIDREHASDERVEIEVRGRRIAALVTQKPFYSRTK